MLKILINSSYTCVSYVTLKFLAFHNPDIRERFYLSQLYVIISRATVNILVQNNFYYNESIIKWKENRKNSWLNKIFTKTESLTELNYRVVFGRMKIGMEIGWKQTSDCWNPDLFFKFHLTCLFSERPKHWKVEVFLRDRTNREPYALFCPWDSLFLCVHVSVVSGIVSFSKYQNLSCSPSHLKVLTVLSLAACIRIF
jgi:hypothetical protein